MDRRRFLPAYHYADNTSGNLTKSIGKPLRDYKIYGESVQNGTPTPEVPVIIESVGNKTVNLFDISQIENVSLSNGGKITNNQDGSLTIEGTYTVNCQKTLSQLAPELKVDDTVVLTAESNAYREGSGKLNILYLADGTTVTFGKPITITQSNLDARVIFYSRMMSSDTTDIEPSYYKNIQLEYGTEATAYEPYGKYKVPIKVIGKNLYDAETHFNAVCEHETLNGYEPTKCIIDGVECYQYWGRNFSGTNETNPSRVIKCNFKENTPYTVSTDWYDIFYTNPSTGITSKGLSITFVYTDGTTSAFIPNPSVRVENKWMHYTQTSYIGSSLDYICISYGTGAAHTYLANFQIEEGKLETAYEPYKDLGTSNIYLAEPLRKAGDIADYIDFSNQCVVRNVRCLSLDGSDDETIILQSTNSYGISNFYLDGLSDMALSEDCVMCNRLSRQTTNVANTMTEGFRFVITTSTYPYMRISSERVSTVADFRAWLSDNVVSFAYATNAPIIEPLELPPIPTAKGTVNIMVDTDIKPSGAVWQYYRK